MMTLLHSFDGFVLIIHRTLAISPMTHGNAHVNHSAKFPDFFKTQCWQPCISLHYKDEVSTLTTKTL